MEIDEKFLKLGSKLKYPLIWINYRYITYEFKGM